MIRNLQISQSGKNATLVILMFYIYSHTQTLTAIL